MSNKFTSRGITIEYCLNVLKKITWIISLLLINFFLYEVCVLLSIWWRTNGPINQFCFKTQFKKFSSSFPQCLLPWNDPVPITLLWHFAYAFSIWEHCFLVLAWHRRRSTKWLLCIVPMASKSIDLFFLEMLLTYVWHFGSIVVSARSNLLPKLSTRREFIFLEGTVSSFMYTLSFIYIHISSESTIRYRIENEYALQYSMPTSIIIGHRLSIIGISNTRYEWSN